MSRRECTHDRQSLSAKIGKHSESKYAAAFTDVHWHHPEKRILFR